MKPRLNIVTLGVQDLERSLHFYRDGLDWKPSSASQDDIVFILLNGVVLAWYPREKLAEDATVDMMGQGFAGITLAYNATSEVEMDEILSMVESIGGRIAKPAMKVFWGGYSRYFADLDGHLWEVAWNPFFEFDDAGNLMLP